MREQLTRPCKEGDAALVALRDVAVEFAGHAAVQDVSLDLRAGEIVVLLGRSGAGKSTLLRCVNLLQRPTRGQVTVRELGAVSGGRGLRQHRRATGMVFQSHQLIGRQSALDNVLMGRLAHRRTLRSMLPAPRSEIAIALECLARVGLADRALRRVDTLSGGERQRVGIARALAQRPRLLLADEPVASLDPATARAVLTQLKSICVADGLTALVSLHQVSLARDFAERVVGLAGGRIVFDGPCCDLSVEVLETIYGVASAPADSGGKMLAEAWGSLQAPLESDNELAFLSANC